MIVIGEKINGAIPSIKEAIANRDAELIKQRTIAQTEAGATFLDCAPSTAPELEYDAMVWLLDIMQANSDLPICIDSPDPLLLERIFNEGLVNKPGMVNSVNMENIADRGTKCDILFPLVAGTEWNIVGLTCDNDGIPYDSQKKVDIAKQMIDKADHYGVALDKFHIDPCVMALATLSSAMKDFEFCIQSIHDYAPQVKVTGAISNISFNMPARKFVNSNCMAYAIKAGLDSAIMDPCNSDMMGTIYACEALCEYDKMGRKYNRAFRAGKFGQKK